MSSLAGYNVKEEASEVKKIFLKIEILLLC